VPKGESQSNAEIESMIGVTTGLMRTFKAALVGRYGDALNPKHAALAWLIQYVGIIYNRTAVGVDGKTPYQRNRGVQFHFEQGVPEFGECMWYRPLSSKMAKRYKLDPDRYLDGVYAGLVDGAKRSM